MNCVFEQILPAIANMVNVLPTWYHLILIYKQGWCEDLSQEADYKLKISMQNTIKEFGIKIPGKCMKKEELVEKEAEVWHKSN